MSRSYDDAGLFQRGVRLVLWQAALPDLALFPARESQSAEFRYSLWETRSPDGSALRELVDRPACGMRRFAGRQRTLTRSMLRRMQKDTLGRVHAELFGMPYDVVKIWRQKMPVSISLYYFWIWFRIIN